MRHVIAFAALTGGVTILAGCGSQTEQSKPAPPAPATGVDAGAAEIADAAPPAPLVRPTHDRAGDPLPAMAWRRLGSTRLRHAGVVRAVVYSPDGKLLASAGDDAVIRLWSTADYRLVRALRGHGGPVLALAFSRDGKRLASGAADKRALLWDVATGAQLRAVGGHARPVSAVGFSGDGKRLMSASADLVQVVNAVSGKREGHYRPGPARSTSFALSRSGNFVFSARDQWQPGGKIDSWRVGNQQAYSSSKPKAWPRAVAVSPAGWKYALLMRWQHAYDPHVLEGYRLEIRDAKTKAVRHTMLRRDRRGDPHLVQFSPDGDRVIVARSNRLDVWDASDGRRLRTIAVPFVTTTSVAVSPNRRTVAVTSDRHHTVLLYDLRTGKPIAGPVAHPGPIVALDVDRRSQRVVVAYGGVEAAAEWDVEKARPRHLFRNVVIGVRRSARGAVYTHDDTRVVTSHDNCLLQVWERASGGLLERIGCRPKRATPRITRAPGAKAIYTFGPASVFRNRHDLAHGLPGATSAVAIGPTSSTAIVATQTQLSVVSLADRRTLHQHALSKVRAVAAHLGSHPLYAAGDDQGKVHVYDGRTHQLLRAFTTEAPPRALAFSRDGRWLATGDSAGVVSIWRARTAERVATFPGHLGAVLSLRFGAGGRLLFSGSADATVLVWDVVGATAATGQSKP